ncbi:MAG: GNAT family N-acetyltransferase [Flavobacteriales bacterium]|nr:GNAT family N-acetyltransferase [Flavobacteriales bacterium]
MDRTKISIQKISLNNLETLQAISSLTFYETFAEVNTKENMSNYLENELSLEKLRLELSNPFSEFYFAYCKKEVIGYLKINFESAQTEQKTANSLEIERIYVRKEYLGKNIGQSLLEAAFQIARAKDLENVWLGVWEENKRAIRFYEKNDFIAFDKHIFLLGEDAQTDILMRRKL